MKPLNDPVTSLKRGVLIPVARAWVIVGLIVVMAVAVTFVTKDGNWFFGIMLGSLPFLWFDERRRRKQRAEERQARDELFGIRRE